MLRPLDALCIRPAGAIEVGYETRDISCSRISRQRGSCRNQDERLPGPGYDLLDPTGESGRGLHDELLQGGAGPPRCGEDPGGNRPEGFADALTVSQAASRELAISDDLILVASTGVIGHRLPLLKIEAGMRGLVEGLHADGIPDAEAGIMTTDRFPKMAIRKGEIGQREVTVCGIAKGAGMIEPHMATMLAFIITDAAIGREALDKVFRQSVDNSFNAISVDGCMSTNDTAIILANGFAGNPEITKRSGTLDRFGEMLSALLAELARGLVRDGEGATKVIEITVEEAKTLCDAKRVAYAIANSNLVKTAFFGGDPNWGRIISAAGSVGIDLPVDKVRLFFEGIPIFACGKGVPDQEEELAAIMKQSEIRVRIGLGMGRRSWTVCTSDLSFDYVKINAHYHT
jgi:glutamate N-acetyltransferase/amino-acid N-acetyltransferase